MIDELEPELDIVSAILQAITARLETVWTVLPARVTAVQDGLVTAEPTVMSPTGSAIPPVIGVRVVQPLAGSVGVGLPVGVGTPGLLVACTLDPSGWLLRGSATAVPTAVRHALGYSVFIPGVGPGVTHPTKPTIGDMSHTAYPIARGDVVDKMLVALHGVLSGQSGTATMEPLFADLQLAWQGQFGATPLPPTASSSDAEVTSD